MLCASFATRRGITTAIVQMGDNPRDIEEEAKIKGEILRYNPRYRHLATMLSIRMYLLIVIEKYARVNFYDLSASYHKNKKNDAPRDNSRKTYDRHAEFKIRELEKENQNLITWRKPLGR